MKRDDMAVLVVEDEILSRMLLEEFVRAGEFSVTTARDALDALTKIQKFRFGLMVTDIAMPGQLDGNGLIETALALDPTLAVVIVTGDPASVTPILAARWPVLGKPVNPNDLVATIRRMLVA